MTLAPLTVEKLIRIARWRNQDVRPYRTTRMLTEQDQINYMQRLTTDKNIIMWAIEIEQYMYDETRFVDKAGIHDPHVLIGYGGLENIDWVNRTAEISLLIGPDYRGEGHGSFAVGKILVEAFQRLGLHTVWGEAYGTTDAWKFWKQVVEEYNGSAAWHPARKYLDGKWYHSYIFDITVNGVSKCNS